MASTVDLQPFFDVPFPVEAVLDGPRLRVSELMALSAGTVIPIGVPAGDNINVTVGDSLVGAGELSVADGRLMVRMVETGQGIAVESIQQATAVFIAVALLGATLYWLRTKGIVRFTAQSGRTAGEKQLQSLERLPLTAQHSLHLVRVAGRLVLIAVSPGGCSVLDRGDTDLQKRDA